MEADDLTQDVLVQMIRKMESFHGDARFSTWLYTVTRHAAADRHRKQAAEPVWRKVREHTWRPCASK